MLQPYPKAKDNYHNDCEEYKNRSDRWVKTFTAAVAVAVGAVERIGDSYEFYWFISFLSDARIKLLDPRLLGKHY